MPGEFDNYEIADDERDVTSLFEEWLDARTDEPGGMTLFDFDNISIVMYVRLRSLFTPAQLHARAHAIIMQGETMIQTPGAFTDTETGEPTEPILVENFQGNAEEYMAMLKGSMKEISDDEIAAFLKGEEE